MRWILVLGIIFSLVSCEDDFRFSRFCDAVALDDIDYVAGYMDNILENLDPDSNRFDFIGHEENLFDLVDELNERNNCLFASLICYACIETFPLQSEILISVDDGGFSTERIIDISTPEDEVMFVVGMHLP